MSKEWKNWIGFEFKRSFKEYAIIADTPAETDRRDEIDVEVSDEMIRAGVREFAGFNHEFEAPASMVERVFLAMFRAGLRGKE